jgi:hypothetical protein
MRVFLRAPSGGVLFLQWYVFQDLGYFLQSAGALAAYLREGKYQNYHIVRYLRLFLSCLLLCLSSFFNFGA